MKTVSHHITHNIVPARTEKTGNFKHKTDKATVLDRKILKKHHKQTISLKLPQDYYGGGKTQGEDQPSQPRNNALLKTVNLDEKHVS